MVSSIYDADIIAPHCLVNSEGNVNFLGTRCLVYDNTQGQEQMEELPNPSDSYYEIGTHYFLD